MEKFKCLNPKCLHILCETNEMGELESYFFKSTRHSGGKVYIECPICGNFDFDTSKLPELAAYIVERMGK